MTSSGRAAGRRTPPPADRTEGGHPTPTPGGRPDLPGGGRAAPTVGGRVDLTAGLVAELASWTWRLDAACGGLPSSVFFSPDGERGAARRRRERAAKAVCRDCAVRERCAAYALAYKERYGVWGGLSEHEREAIWCQLAREPARRHRESTERRGESTKRQGGKA
jgi:WhiB family redox-sensing transcriptional regulator